MKAQRRVAARASKQTPVKGSGQDGKSIKKPPMPGAMSGGSGGCSYVGAMVAGKSVK